MSKDLIYLIFGFAISIGSIAWGWNGLSNKNKYKNNKLDNADKLLSFGQIISGVIVVIGLTLMVIIHGCPK